MSRRDSYNPGDWNATCYDCGRKFKASEMRKQWQGYYVCERDWRERHPQDFVRGIPDREIPPWTQPPPEDIFIAMCDLDGITSFADRAVADCAICDGAFTGEVPSVPPVEPPAIPGDFLVTESDTPILTDLDQVILVEEP